MKITAYITDKYKNNRLQRWKIDNVSEFSETITIDTKTQYQTFIGFGGAFTESSGYNLSRINKELRKKALEAYFSKDGLNYCLGRIAIGGCDFSLGSYSYVDDYDEELKFFSIERDKKYIIPLVLEAQAIKGDKISLLASPWSPPFWMKDNGLYNYGGKLKKCFYETWANYFVKFIQEYQKEKLEIFAVTIQNEPAANQRWDSCLYSPIEENDFLGVIGTKFNEKNITSKIYVWDHNRDVMLERVKPIYESDNNKYAFGTAIHWYDNEPYENLDKHHKLYPDKHLLHTEGCVEGRDKMGLYEGGERYGRNIIGNFNNYCEGFIDWNLFLDETGGPNWVNNLCDAPIIINVGPEKLIYEPSYYYIGHFSKFIKLNAKRVHVDNQSNVLVCCFKNPDWQVIVVIQNETEEDKDLRLDIDNEELIIRSEKRSIMTLIIEG